MSFKTLLVDDDYLVRSYLKILPVWEQEKFQVIADVRDGEEALKVLKETPVDLIVTDISMPLVNGIELIRKVRKHNSSVYIIVLSCHDDFEYVKESMKLGADEYVLKNTLEERTLVPVLTQAREAITARRKTSGETKSPDVVPRMINENSEFLFFNKVLSGNSSEQETEAMRKHVGIAYPFHNCAVVSMMIQKSQDADEQWFELEMEQYFLEFHLRLRGALEREQGAEGLSCEVIYLGMGVFCCFIDLSDECRSSVMSQKVIQTATACYRICKDEPHLFQIGASGICMGTQAIRQAYQQSRTALKSGFYEDKQILYYDSERRLSEQLPDKAQQLLSEADELFYQGKKERFVLLGGQACKSFIEKRTTRRVVVQWLRDIQGITRTEVYEAHMIRSIRQVEEALEKLAEQIGNENVQMEIPVKANITARMAAEYVQKHYREPIGLTEVAEAVGINASYLSYLFSQEMNIGFSAYLLNQRMKYAMKMLKTTNLKINEISSQSGFNDYHYFAKTFKKLNGLSPADYRKKK
jgi:two-component system response regulator YesN